jgi:hypothetical protein
MLCPLRVSANNNSWTAPRRRGYSLDSDGEPRSPYEGNTIGAADDTRERPGGVGRYPGPDVTYVSAASPWSPEWTGGAEVQR